MNFESHIIKNLISNPRKIFLLDGFGAILSVFSLGIILIQFESWFGMPKEKLYYLAIVAVIFAIYSLTCYIRFPNNWRVFLAIIAVSNAIYSLITLCLIVLFYQDLTILGLAYFILEIIILMLLIYFEFTLIFNKMT